MFQTIRGVKPSGRAPVDTTGTPNTIAGIDEARLRVVHYYDDRGRPTNEVVMEIAGILYAPPNSIEWCGALRQLSPQQLSLIRAYEAKHAPVPVPTKDEVDVLPAAEAEEAGDVG